MSLVSNDEFLVKLAQMYRDSRIGGAKTVYVTMKPYDGRKKAVPKKTGLQTENGVQCLFRAKLGHTRRISTAVSAKDVNKFHAAYVGVLRANIDNLEKRKKTEEEKKKQKKTSSKA